MPRIILKPGREDSLLRYHPWVFSGAVAEINGNPDTGGTVDIISSKGIFLAKAAYSPRSKILARVWTWNPDEVIDRAFIRQRIMKSIEIRENSTLGLSGIDAVRLVHGESDGLPGLIVDRYKNILVVQFLTSGIEYWRETIIDILRSLSGINGIYERSDADIRTLEGLEIMKGNLWGTETEELMSIEESGIKYLVDIHQGHKTGFYLDQRYNRLLVRRLSRNKDVLDCFSYTGGFTLNALYGGASSVCVVESSAQALALLDKNIEHNGFHHDRVNVYEGDVFQVLRRLRDHGSDFDMIVLDPPKFAHTSTMASRAARGYKDINLLALKLLRPGGLLVTFSCSGGVSAELFQKIVAGAALDAHVDAKIVMKLSQDVDHPIALNFPEGAYLKGLVVYVSGKL